MSNIGFSWGSPESCQGGFDIGPQYSDRAREAWEALSDAEKAEIGVLFRRLAWSVNLMVGAALACRFGPRAYLLDVVNWTERETERVIEHVQSVVDHETRAAADGKTANPANGRARGGSTNG